MILPMITLIIASLYPCLGLWVYLRKARKHQLAVRCGVALLVVFVIALTPIYFQTGYTVSLSFGPALVLALSLGAYLFEVILLWRESRAFGMVGSVAFVAALIVAYLGLYPVLDGSSMDQLTAGRLAPGTSYRVVLTEGGFGAHYYVIEKFTNPPLFPFVQKRIGRGLLPCGGTSDDLRYHRVIPSISPGAKDNTLHVVCVYRDPVLPTESEEVTLLNN